MKLVFIGAGYVGLVSGVLLSHLGHRVTCVDRDVAKIEHLKLGICPIHEPDLEQYLTKGLNNKTLDFASGIQDNFKDAEAVFITVGTPALSSAATDLSSVMEAVAQILPAISPHCLIIIKSTVPPGTNSYLQQHIYSKNYQNCVVSNPEFLREGAAVADFLAPDRIVVGVNDDHAADLLQKIYQPLIAQNIPLLSTDPNSAELIKYAANTFLATKIAFINEMANLCEQVGGDIEKLALGIGLDSRIGPQFLKTGPGFGGSCFPKDILGLAYFAGSIGKSCLLTRAVIEANLKRYHDMAEKIARVYNNNLNNVELAILGVTYKAGTDDVRSSPAIEIIKLLQQRGAKLTIYDPQGIKSAAKILNDVTCLESTDNLWTKKDGIVILTEWPEFTLLDFAAIKFLLKRPIIIDLRNILAPLTIKNFGYKYFSLGRKDD